MSDTFRHFGLGIERFGPGAIAVRETPAMLGETNVQSLIRDLADEIADNDTIETLQARLDRIAATMACHGSVRCRPAIAARGDERAAQADGGDARLRHLQSWPADLYRAQAQRHRAAVRQALGQDAETRLKPISLIRAPCNLGLRPLRTGHEPGTWRAPQALSDAGLVDAIGPAAIVDLARPAYRAEAEPGTLLRNGHTLRRFNLELADHVEQAAGARPVSAGGRRRLRGAARRARRAAAVRSAVARPCRRTQRFPPSGKL